ncbi:cupin domain-containing protein [Bradyrhizobium lablabi]|uniref:cupin domain-containing protein n=1 Tax=Bradyrhizobium lablabi TaxID=722472 RepID=UPI001BAB187E|nr:cupin domain-containing protein [Bradyrhizobium lablabi]MBR1124782.1 cupin domain-containing protein [Bradyrhizobium lablabi]
MNRSICVAAALLILATPLSANADAVKADATSAVKVSPLLTTTVTTSGQPIVLPQGNVQLITSIYEVPPGAKLPEHEHNSQRYGYVLSGRLRITNTETGKSDEFKPGDFIVESRGQWHKAENIGAEPVKLLVIDQVKPGEKTTVLRQTNASAGRN